MDKGKKEQSPARSKAKVSAVTPTSHAASVREIEKDLLESDTESVAEEAANRRSTRPVKRARGSDSPAEASHHNATGNDDDDGMVSSESSDESVQLDARRR
jgi:hypothetical protein